MLLVDRSFFNPPTEEANQNVNQEPPAEQPDSGKGYEVIAPVVQFSPEEQDLMAVARNFAERFGSYSSDSNFNNLEEVKAVSTVKLIGELQDIIDTAEVQPGFYGVSSWAMKVEILESAVGSAQVEVNLQRRETKEGQAEFVYYQKLLLSLIRSGSAWLVDGAEWQ